MEHVFCSYYTKSEYITNYMVSMLKPCKEDIILEPSAGDGVFIDKILEIDKDFKIDALDLNKDAVEILKEKYKSLDNITTVNTDTLLDLQMDKYVATGGHYTKIIGNPPYGGWQEMDKREELKSKYIGHYVKETYSLFLLRCISLLEDKGRLVFIIPDTYMFLHRHEKLREHILKNTKIKEILTFPSKLFPGVKFQYSKLSIVTLEKSNDSNSALENEFRIITDITKEEDFNSIRNNDTSRFTVISKNQKEIYDNPSHSFFLSEKNDVINIINNAETTLGDICSCVTGIYVGNNTKYIEVISEDTKNSKGYTVVDSNKINNDYMNEDILSGLEGEQTYIPIVKGASNDRYIRSSYPWYVNWSKEAIKEYNTNKKARFQNSQFYFKKGIVVPMIKSSKFRATLIDNMVFDQSVVGVFPNEEIYVLYILAFLNSDVARDLIQVINPSANNSANYVKKIPVILPSEEGLEYVNGKVGNILTLINTGSNEDIESYQEEINQFFNELYYK
ncbi:TPA: N-6 DNA methylase [Clostridioides difficile]|nr:N-6 DNA methylase [Clostridioides difficile]